MRTWPLPAAGFYALTLADSRHDLVAANISRLESDLTPASDDKLKLWQAAEPGPGTCAARTRPPRRRRPRKPGRESIHNLWWYAMCLLLVAVVTESLVSSRYLNAQQEP